MTADTVRHISPPVDAPEETPELDKIPAPEPPVKEAHATAIAAIAAGPLHATTSAIGTATVEGDATLASSAVGMLSTKGDATLKQGFAGAIMSEGDTSVSQGGAPLVVARRIGIDQGGIGVAVTGEARTSKSFVGVLLARKAEVSEDSRVLLDWKAVLVLTVVLFGVAGMVGVALFLMGRRVMGSVSHLAERLPHLPELPEWANLGRLRHGA